MMYRFSPAPWSLNVRPGTALAKSVKSLTPMASNCAEPIAVMAVGMDCAVSSPRLRAVTRTSDRPASSAAAGLSAAFAVRAVPAIAQATANADCHTQTSREIHFRSPFGSRVVLRNRGPLQPKK